jgi:hypothetical protein
MCQWAEPTVALKLAQLGFRANLTFQPVATKTGEVVPMASERRRRSILAGAGDKVGRGQWLELHGEEGNLIWGSRESRSSLGERTMAAAVWGGGERWRWCGTVVGEAGSRSVEQQGATTELRVASPVVYGGQRCRVNGVVPLQPGWTMSTSLW